MNYVSKKNKLDYNICASGKNIKSSVQKINLVASLIRNQRVDRAIVVLSFCRKKSSIILDKILKSAMANAQNNYGVDTSSLYISSIFVGKGISVKRFSARAKGKADKIIKHYSKIKIVLKVL